MNAKWFWDKKGQIEDEVFNKSGNEMIFEDSGWDSLAREIIQNSLDAKIKDSIVPVNVTFSYDIINSKNNVFLISLKDLIKKCLNENQLNENVRRKFASGYEQLKKDKVSVINITDSNTTGLLGCQNPISENNNYWYSLLGQTGKSDKGLKNSSGSQGIGKFAPYSFSLLSTVFYGTNINGSKNNRALQGIGRLTSFKDNNEYCQPKVTFCNKDKFEKYHPIYNEFYKFPKYFVPQETGTSVSIIAARTDSKIITIKKEFLHSVLKNFFVAIDKGLLTVDVMDTYIINKDTLDSLMNNYIDSSDKHFQMYFAYKYGEKSFHKHGVLYYDHSDNVKYTTINIMKNKGMLINDYKISGLYSEIIGIFIIEDEIICEQVKALENATHTKFVTKSEKSDSPEIKEIIKYIKNLKIWIKEKCKEATKPILNNQIPLVGYEDLLNIFDGSDTAIKNRTSITFIDSGKQTTNKVSPPSKPYITPYPPIKLRGEIQQNHIPRILKYKKEVYVEFTSSESGTFNCKLQIISDDNKPSNNITISDAILNDNKCPHTNNSLNKVYIEERVVNKLLITLKTETNYRLDFKLFSMEVATNEN